MPVVGGEKAMVGRKGRELLKSTFGINSKLDKILDKNLKKHTIQTDPYVHV